MSVPDVRERQGDVAVADQQDGRLGEAQALERDLLAEHVVPDRVARARVEELGLVARPGRLERAEPGAVLLAEHVTRPVGGAGRIAAELREIERADHREVVVAAERRVGASPDQRAALVRLRPVADDVPEAPQLVRRLAVDVRQDRLECVKIGVDV